MELEHHQPVTRLSWRTLNGNALQDADRNARQSEDVGRVGVRNALRLVVARRRRLSDAVQRERRRARVIVLDLAVVLLPVLLDKLLDATAIGVKVPRRNVVALRIIAHRARRGELREPAGHRAVLAQEDEDRHTRAVWLVVFDAVEAAVRRHVADELVVALEHFRRFRVGDVLARQVAEAAAHLRFEQQFVGTRKSRRLLREDRLVERRLGRRRLLADLVRVGVARQRRRIGFARKNGWRVIVAGRVGEVRDVDRHECKLLFLRPRRKAIFSRFILEVEEIALDICAIWTPLRALHATEDIGAFGRGNLLRGDVQIHRPLAELKRRRGTLAEPQWIRRGIARDISDRHRLPALDERHRQRVTVLRGRREELRSLDNDFTLSLADLPLDRTGGEDLRVFVVGHLPRIGHLILLLRIRARQFERHRLSILFGLQAILI